MDPPVKPAGDAEGRRSADGASGNGTETAAECEFECWPVWPAERHDQMTA
jgi:hypothetical protein